MSEINLSFWDIERIQAEQDKHMSFAVSGVIPTVKPEDVERNLEAIDDALDAYIRKVVEDTDMYIICELAKMYVESLRPAEWIEDSGNIACSHCHTIWLYRRTDYCPNCGRRMKHEQVSHD